MTTRALGLALAILLGSAAAAEEGDISVLVEQGTSRDAESYYRKAAKELGFRDAKPPENFDALISYVGYRGLRAADLDRLDSFVLMDFQKLRQNVSNKQEFEKAFGRAPIRPGDILATRFFAPKITDVSPAPPFKLGWRRLVRLTPRAGSGAARKGIRGAYLLFNYFEADLKKNPFAQPSVNNQVILVRGSSTTLSNGAYFFVFDKAANKNKRIGFLEASFDARDRRIRKYFVPAACVQCHGNDDRHPKLNLLDTDHWFDRVQPHEDFEPLARSAHSPVFDGGKDQSSPQYRFAYDVIRRLNTEIFDQIRKSDREADVENSFQVRAAASWLKLHASNTGYLPPIKRPIPPVSTGGPSWSERSAVDRELLPLLNQYCYRCHSSFDYNVFDKEAVVSRAVAMAGKIEKGEMPQDRQLAKKLRDTLTALLRRVH